MFAAVLVIFSLASPSCDAIPLKPFPNKQECVDQTTAFVRQHAPEIASAHGKFEFAIWCRAPRGGKSA